MVVAWRVRKHAGRRLHAAAAFRLSASLRVCSIVVSGNSIYASGQGTLICDFLAAHPTTSASQDPFELIDESLRWKPDAAPSSSSCGSSARQLLDVTQELGRHRRARPLDFLAYLSAMDELGRGGQAGDLFERGLPLAAAAMEEVDLLVLLPWNATDRIHVPASGDLALRDAMNDALLELCDDADLVGDQTRVEELVARRPQRLDRLTAMAARS